MRVLLDTHLLVWAAEGGERISSHAASIMDDAGNELFFSVVSL